MDHFSRQVETLPDRMQVDSHGIHNKHNSEKKTESKLDSAVGVEMVTLNEAKMLGGGTDVSDFDMGKSEKRQKIHKLQNEIQSTEDWNKHPYRCLTRDSSSCSRRCCKRKSAATFLSGSRGIQK